MLALPLALLAMGATAAETSGAATLLSDYTFRGLDRADGPALQGEVDAFGESGWYAGGWISNNRVAGGSEFDAYGGWSRRLKAFGVVPASLDAGLIGYLFPGAESLEDGTHRNTDFAEAYSGIRAGPLGFKVYASPDFQNAGGFGASLRGSLRWPFTAALTGVLEAGANLGPSLKDYVARLTQDGRGRDYLDYAASLEYRLPQDFVVAAEFSGTTLDLADGPGRSGSQPKILVRISRRFDF